MILDLSKLIAALESHTKALFAHAEALATGGGEAAPKKTRGRPAAGETNGVAVDPTAAAASAPAASSVAAPAATAAAPASVSTAAVSDKVATVPTLQQVADKIIDLANNHSRDKAVAILAKYGVKKVPELKPADFAAVLLDVEAAKVPAASDSLV